jgi:hypothetical protein
MATAKLNRLRWALSAVFRPVWGSLSGHADPQQEHSSQAALRGREDCTEQEHVCRQHAPAASPSMPRPALHSAQSAGVQTETSQRWTLQVCTALGKRHVISALGACSQERRIAITKFFGGGGGFTHPHAILDVTLDQVCKHWHQALQHNIQPMERPLGSAGCIQDRAPSYTSGVGSVSWLLFAAHPSDEAAT